MKVLESYCHLYGHCQMKHDESEYKYEIDAAVVMSLELTTNCSISKNDLFFGFVCESVLLKKTDESFTDFDFRVIPFSWNICLRNKARVVVFVAE